MKDDPAENSPGDSPEQAPVQLSSVGYVMHALGVSRTRAYYITDRHVGEKAFPLPFGVLYQGAGDTDRKHARVWLRSDVDAWLDRHHAGWRDTVDT
ncbi:Predicted DNA-binding transcriptional regulator AlpA [Parafrankia irregularis]|uniref:Predicted DNA-binding transcriptional regulator AlpA n=1 Tax=Parafrankia irregularis TaxID=795642 RepID=A0A0S4QG14_9ACTN|nr:Predicted DNA-binding transcriptional regulator AlpA [Parafrankia irregularis]